MLTRQCCTIPYAPYFQGREVTHFWFDSNQVSKLFQHFKHVKSTEEYPVCLFWMSTPDTLEMLNCLILQGKIMSIWYHFVRILAIGQIIHEIAEKVYF